MHVYVTAVSTHVEKLSTPMLPLSIRVKKLSTSMIALCLLKYRCYQCLVYSSLDVISVFCFAQVY